MIWKSPIKNLTSLLLLSLFTASIYQGLLITTVIRMSESSVHAIQAKEKRSLSTMTGNRVIVASELPTLYKGLQYKPVYDRAEIINVVGLRVGTSETKRVGPSLQKLIYC